MRNALTTPRPTRLASQDTVKSAQPSLNAHLCPPGASAFVTQGWPRVTHLFPSIHSPQALWVTCRAAAKNPPGSRPWAAGGADREEEPPGHGAVQGPPPCRLAGASPCCAP